eukprot:Opistho-2@50517
MFYYLTLSHDVLLHPQYFGPMLKQTLRQKLYSEVEGTCKGEFGWIIMVKDIEEFGRGKIHANRGIVTFSMRYTAVVFRPFKGEVVEAVVKDVNKLGVFCQVGPIEIFISNKQMPPKMKYLPNAVPHCYVSPDEDYTIVKDVPIKVKIVGLRIDAANVVCIGSILDEFLG